jgi:hypothetical protein
MSTVYDLPESAERLYQETSISADAKGWKATATWSVPYAELADFLEVAGGVETEVYFPGLGSITRIVPLEFPDPVFRGKTLYAESVTGSTHGLVAAADHPDGYTYNRLKLKVHFRTYEWDANGSSPFLTEQFDGASEYITIPGSAFKFPSDNRRINHEIGVHIPGLDFSLTLHKLPRLNVATWTALQGRVNSTVFLPSFYDLPAGTVLYLGPSASSQTDIGGVRSYQVTHRFRFRWIPHNQIMRPDGAGFEAPVRMDNSGAGILETADLNEIFV